MMNAQQDSSKIPERSINKYSYNTELIVSSRNVWRGLNYGSSPSAQGNLALTHEYFDIGSYATATLNGNKSGYGNWLELYLSGKYKSFSLTVDDYFFFNADDSLNNYFDWAPDKTQHFIEGRVKYDGSSVDITAGYCFYRNTVDKTNGVYIEAEYAATERLSFVIAGVTSSNWLSFYDGGGITTLGVSYKRDALIKGDKLLTIKPSLIFNPNYGNALVYTGVGNNPVYFVVSIIF